MNKFEAKVSEIMSRMTTGGEETGAVTLAPSQRKRVTRQHMGLADFLSTHDAAHFLSSIENGFTQFTDELNELSFLEAQLDIEPQYDDDGVRVYDLSVLLLMQSKMAA